MSIMLGMCCIVDGEIPCSLEDVLIFFSGSDQVPPLGFEKEPAISFHDSVLATSSTCDLQLRLPMHGSYTRFREAMYLSTKGNDGFGEP